MMNREQAVAYGRQIGVKFYIYNNHGALVGGTTTRAAAEEMKSRMEREDRKNPFTRGTTRFIILEADKNAL